jgi:predicted nucleic acid-binding Zn ribbon protein
MARRGFAAVRSAVTWEAAWREVAGALLADSTRVGPIRGGNLEIIVANSTLLQELSFRKPALLKSLAKRLPEHKIKGLRFRVGPID